MPDEPEYKEDKIPVGVPDAKGASYENHIGRVVPKASSDGYKTKAERWNAMSQVLKLNETRMINGLKMVSDDTLWRHCKFTYEELYKEASIPEFRDMRMSRAKGELGDGLTDVVGHVKAAIRAMADDSMKNPKDAAKREKFLKVTLDFAEKFGIYDVDSSKANMTQEMDTDAAVQECMALFKELTGSEVPVQKFLKVAVIDGINTIGGKQDDEVSFVNQPSKDSKGD
jgi:hypothetical protein